MAKTSNLNIRVDPEIKSEAEELFTSFGITLTDAVNIFLCMSIDAGGFPFAIRRQRYNAQTEKAMAEARDIAAGKIKTKQYSSAKELLDELDDELAAEDRNADA